MASSTPSATAPGLTHQFLTFALGQEEYGVEILNLRGTIAPIVDLRQKFGMPAEAMTAAEAAATR
jgi:chemotaxis signal transduction protein